MAGKKWKVITLSCRKGYHTQAYQKGTTLNIMSYILFKLKAVVSKKWIMLSSHTVQCYW